MSWNLEINGELLYRAQDYYESASFQPTATPWLVSEEAYCATCPPEATRWSSPLGLYHVASAEQGFIQMMLDGNIPCKQLQATSPCFRHESYDNLHKPYFYKLELYSPEATEKEMWRVIKLAAGLFETLGVSCCLEQTGESAWDLVDDRQFIELGSYGLRKFQHHEWVYATGIALPRFDIVKQIRS